jgi:hypothetical protein
VIALQKISELQLARRGFRKTPSGRGLVKIRAPHRLRRPKKLQKLLAAQNATAGFQHADAKKGLGENRGRPEEGK